MSMHPQPCEYIDIEVEDREDAIEVLEKLTNLKGMSGLVQHSDFEDVDEMAYFVFENGDWVVEIHLDPFPCNETGKKTDHPSVFLYYRHVCQEYFRDFDSNITKRLLSATKDVLPSRNVQSYVGTMWL